MLVLLAALLLPSIVWCSAQPRVAVVTVATEDTDGLRRLLKSAETFNIEVEVLGMGEEWNGGDTRVEQGGGQKIRLLRNALKKYADEKNMIILFVDAYDVVFTASMDTILDRFLTHYEDYRVLFGAEPYCWPDESLAIEYPVVEFGKRYLNSGLFMGYAKEVYQMISLKDVADNDDDQLYYTMVYLDDKLRKDLKIGLDSVSRIFQNLNGVVDDVELQFDDAGTALAYNAAYNTHPAILHGNGPSKRHLNYLANYVANRWSSTKGCVICGKKTKLDLAKKDPADFPLVAVTLFTAKPIPFIEEMLEAFARHDYPKKRIALFIYNSQRSDIKTVMEFLSKYGSQYYTKKIINGVSEIQEREARQEALTFASRHGAEYMFSLDGDAFLTETKTLQYLIEYSVNYEVGIIAPMLAQPGKMFTNFWGDIAPNGYYARSEDYLAIVQRKRVGFWNVPFVTTALLINKEKMKEMKTPYFYDKTLDVDMSFCKWARDKGHFMYVDNEKDFGFLIVSDEYAEILQKGKLHPEMWEIFENRQLWETRYVHPDYHRLLKKDTVVDQACTDVYDYPLVSERFCKEMIEEMEHYGHWSDGSNKDERLAGGYENVPTRDIHMRQIDYERHWLYFLDEYVRPIQEKVFTGYYHQPVESTMMFVVRYRPDEQASLRPHHDASTFSIDIALNKKGVDYEGGGVAYPRYNCVVPADQVGWAMMFPGRLTHLHEGLPTTKGTRYILVSFINP
ncbi:Multifunctional procollagen lysine hydroxylase and glycosyltransferase [Trichostrongylus colubriformis]|uniref:procollagen-lysine 5-dioxygenase n=1 Tax=Trichostrongylus colubriformis TaxID=6319 RepID=A0AAN8GF58_TRICO